MARRGRRARGGAVRGSPARLLLLVAALALAVLAAGVTGGRRVARQVWSLVGVRAVEAHADTIRAAAAESGVDPCLLAAVMYVESRGRVDAVSSRGALGLFQLMPAAASDAARRLGEPEPTREDLLADPLLNARLGANHMAWLFEHEGPDPERVLVAYNAGRSRMREWAREAGGFEAWRTRRSAEGGSQVLAYAAQVLEFAGRFRERGVIAPSAIASAAEMLSGEETRLPE